MPPQSDGGEVSGLPEDSEEMVRNRLRIELGVRVGGPLADERNTGDEQIPLAIFDLPQRAHLERTEIDVQIQSLKRLSRDEDSGDHLRWRVSSWKWKGRGWLNPRSFPGVPGHSCWFTSWDFEPANLYAVAFAATGSGRLAIIMATKETAARTPAT